MHGPCSWEGAVQLESLQSSRGIPKIRPCEVRQNLEAKGISCAHLNARFIKPLDEAALAEYASRCKLIVTLEDHSIYGGFGSAVMEKIGELGKRTPVLRIGWPDTFVEHGSLMQLRTKHRLTAEHITADILAAYTTGQSK